MGNRRNTHAHSATLTYSYEYMCLHYRSFRHCLFLCDAVSNEYSVRTVGNYIICERIIILSLLILNNNEKRIKVLTKQNSIEFISEYIFFQQYAHLSNLIIINIIISASDKQIMLSELLLVTGVTLILYAFYKWVTQNNDYFEKRGIKSPKPVFLLGNTSAMLTSSMNAAEFATQLYNAFPHERISGFFDTMTPVYLIRDVELVKRLTVKDFDHFEDHRMFMPEDSDNLFVNSLGAMKGEKWRDMRSTLSPAFTGSKMRQMFELVSECGDELIGHLQERAKTGEVIDFEMKDMFSRFTNDVIASCAFGIKVNSIKDPKNEFFVAGQKFNSFSSITVMARIMVIRLLPMVAKFFKIDFISADVTNFFRSVVISTIQEREEKNIFRPDMINILMQMRKGTISSQKNGGADDPAEAKDTGFATVEESSIGHGVVKRKWTDTQLVSQAFVFFFAGKGEFFASSPYTIYTIH